MACQVIWSKEATSDLESIAEYIAKDSTFYAAAFIQELIDAGRSLRNFSDRGRMVPELSNPNVRELFVREYRLIYIIEGLRVGILGIIHGKRDLKKLWEKEKR